MNTEIDIMLPAEVEYIMDELEKSGYESYAVGGCVRDSIMGNKPKDWDICTSAPPDQVMKCFEKHTVVETGLKHGTVTLILKHKPFEITTYRIDGEYADNRRPDAVEFVSDLKKDLSRRDFTVNAMAYNPKVGIVDYFNGIADINAKIIRCVGSADKRFQEDALRIMRALRFASVLGFSIDKNTSDAIYTNKKLLKNIAVERIVIELNKLIVGDDAGSIIFEYTPVMAEIIPKIAEVAADGDIWKGTVSNIDSAPADVVSRLSMLLRDVAAHYDNIKDSSEVASIAKKILKRLKYDNMTIKNVAQIILYQSEEIKAERTHIKRWLNIMGEPTFRQLTELKKADIKYQEISALTDKIIEQGQCYALKDLKVTGTDLIDDAGVRKGALVGKILNRLLDMVIDEEVENDREKLLQTAKDLIENYNQMQK